MADLRLTPEATRTDIQSSFSGFYQVAAPDRERPTGGGAGLMELAKGLGVVSDAFDRYATKETAEQREADILEARSLRIQNQMNFAEATRQGLIPMGMNPWAIKEYHRVDGEITAQDNYKAFIDKRLKDMNFVAADYTTEEMAAAALRGELGRAQQEYLKTYGANSTHEWMLGFQQGSRGVHETLVSTYQADRAKFNEEKFTAATGAVVNQILADPEADPATKASKLDTLAKERRGQFGMGFKEFNDIVVSQTTSQAVALSQAGRHLEAQEALEVLSAIPTGPGSTLAMTAADKILETELRISQIERNQKEDARSDIRWGWQLWAQEQAVEDAAWKNAERQRTLVERGKDEMKDALLTDGMLTMLRDGGGDHEPMYREILNGTQDKKLAADVVRELQSFEAARYSASQRTEEDVATITDLRVGIEEGTARVSEIAAAYSSRKINGGTFMSLMDDYRARRSELGSASRGGQQAKEEVFDQVISDIRSVIQGSDNALSDVSLVDERRAKAMSAATYARRLYREWKNANPEATTEDYYKFGDFIRERVLNDSRYRTTGDQGASAPYQPVEDVSVTNPDGSFTPFGQQVNQLVQTGTLTFRSYTEVNRFAADYSRAVLAGKAQPPTPEMLITTGAAGPVPTALYVALAIQHPSYEAKLLEKFPNIDINKYRGD